jgi:predicted Zn-dependent peptidase
VRLHCFWLDLCLALLLAPASTLAQAWSDPSMAKEPAPPLQRATLPNGLRVWTQPRPSSESVAALLVFRAGSRCETAANSDVSHYVEHMVFTGTDGE